MIDVVERRTDEATLCVALALCEPLVALGLSSACTDAGIGILAQAPVLAAPPGPNGARVVVVGDPASLPSDVIGGLVAQQAGVLVLAHGLNADVVRSSVRAGARGYLDLSSALDVIVDGIRAVSEGHLALALSCQAALFAAPPEHERPPLSARETEILVLMSRGLTNREIAAELFVTPETVKTHLKRLGDKLGERRRAGMVSCASRLGLLSVAPLAVAVPL